jgi:hypothetical protein
MKAEAGLWVALSVLAPVVAAVAWPRLVGRLGGWAPMAAQAGPWLHSLAPGYLALLRGAVLGRDYGLYGQGWDGWLSGAAVCAGTLVAGGWLLRRLTLPTAIVLPAPADGLRQEVRWGLYRAAGALWSGAAPGGVAVGLILAMVEWALARRVWAGGAWRTPAAWVPVARMALSGALFLATRNFWLTAVAQIGLLFLARAAGSRSSPPGDAGEGATPKVGE